MQPKTQIHRFLPGLRFHSFWNYQTRGATGRVRWARLPMVSDACTTADPHGAWWCAQRCAAVLARRPWRSMRLPAGLPPHPGAEEVAQEMQQWLVGWSVVTATVERCAHALERGGSALLQLQVWTGATPVPRWAWVVGLELEASLPRHRPVPLLSALPMQPRALLIVPFGQDMPWATGHTARVRLYGQGLDAQSLHEVVAHSGYWLHDSGRQAVVLEPRWNSAATAGSQAPGQRAG